MSVSNHVPLKQTMMRLAQAGHRAGTFSSDVLMAIADVLPSGPLVSLETGCGKSTIMFSNLSEQHYVFAYDDRADEDSSVTMVQSDPDFKSANTIFVYGPTQRTLPTYQFPQGTMFDVVVIDGPHGYPFPDLEYALLYERLKTGAILVLDDVHIASIGNMYDVLREDRMYEEVGVFSTTGVLKRTAIKGVPPDGDHWYEQNYNVRRFPLSMDKYKIDRSVTLGKTLDLADGATLAKHGAKGLEPSKTEPGAQTIDLAAMFEFDLPPETRAKTTLELVYKSIHPDAAAGASIVVGGQSWPLEPRSEWGAARIEFDRPDSGRLRVVALHPNAVPEHDRGLARYEFRRLGSVFKSLELGDMDSAPVAKKKKRKVARLLSKALAIFQ